LISSHNLREEVNRSATTKWASDIVDAEEYLNVVLFLIHPSLHKVGSDVLARLRQLDDMKEIASLWTSVYTGIAVISNRRTPSHLDTNGRPEWYDLLSVQGSMAGFSRLVFEDLGLSLVYRSGTVVAACGQILHHSVSFWGEGDRVCYAHFMQDKVRERFGIDPGEWVTQSLYVNYLSEAFCMQKGFRI
jgi:hypothetical protein